MDDKRTTVTLNDQFEEHEKQRQVGVKVGKQQGGATIKGQEQEEGQQQQKITVVRISFVRLWQNPYKNCLDQK